MGLLILQKAQQAMDFMKIKALLLNPLSESLLAELTRQRDGRYGIEDIIDSYPDRPDSISWLGFKATRRILGIINEAIGCGDQFEKIIRREDIRRTILNVLLSVRKYGVSQPQRFYAPLMVVWNLTWKCNLKCKHCYENAGPLGVKSTDNELTLDEKLAAIDHIADSFIPTISISGGEPFCHPHFWPVLEKARARGLYTSLNTNGTLITKETAQRLVDLNVAYAGISVDGPSAAYHDEFRGMPGAWEKTLQGIRNLAETPVFTIMSFTITRDSIRYLREMFELAEELKMDKVMVYNYIPTGRGEGNFDMDPTPEQREEALSLMYEFAASGRLVCSTAPQFGRVCVEMGAHNLLPLAHAGTGKAGNLNILAQIIGGCGVGRAYLALQPDGRITPCVYMPYIEVGNIREDSILDIWHNNELLESLACHDDLEGHCGVCEHKSVCGGCRARAYAYYGDFKAPDPGCLRNKDHCQEFDERRIRSDSAGPS